MFIKKIISASKSLFFNSFIYTSLLLILYSLISPNILSLNNTRVPQELLFNALSHPLGSAWPWATGLTAWNSISQAESGIYFVELISYLPALVINHIFTIEATYSIQRIIDIITIAGSISLFSDIITKYIIKAKSEAGQAVTRIITISCFILSPWAAYMLYETDWFEPIFMLSLITSFTCFHQNKHNWYNFCSPLFNSLPICIFYLLYFTNFCIYFQE